jgi:hypothetical protein
MKTWLGCYPQIKERTLLESSLLLSDHPSLFPPEDGEAAVVSCVVVAESPRGGYWMLNTSGCHSADAVSLSSVLEPEASIPPKYYLSSKACQGILRRADKRGKALPPVLEQALRARAYSTGRSQESTEQ